MKKNNTLIQSVQRALMVLETVAKEKEGIGVTELSRKVKLDKSTTFRMLNTLEYHGYLSQQEKTEKYHLGLKVLELSRSLMGMLDLREKAKPFLQDLMEKTQETVFLGVLTDKGVAYLDAIECSQLMRMTSPKFGQRARPYVTGLGKVLLAYSPDEVVEEICSKIKFKAFTKKAIINKKQLKAELKKIRQKGYALDDKEGSDSCRCLAAPIRDCSGKVIAAVSIAGPTERISLAKVKTLAPLVIETSCKISQSMGYNNENNGF